MQKYIFFNLHIYINLFISYFKPKSPILSKGINNILITSDY